MSQDLRYGLRQLRRQPGFAALAILTMALGIGATTMLFSVAYGVLLKPLPWPDADRLIRVTERRQGRTGRVVGTVSNGTFLAWHDDPATIEDIGGWLTQTATMTGAGDPLRLSVIPTTPGLFQILGARPLVGRLFANGEGALGRPGLIILSYGLWQERFGGRGEIIGQLVQLDDQPYTIVGVMPRDFAFPDRETRVWTAWSVPPVNGEGGALQGVIFRAIARLRPDATPAQAAAEATARARRAPDLGVVARALFGATGPIDVHAELELQAMTAEVRPAILVLLAAVALLLVTSTLNVASLQLARATTRRREMAVRAAIGAGQRRIVRLLLVENAIIGVGGGAAGLLLAAGLQRVMPLVVPAGFPRLDAVSLDARVLRADRGYDPTNVLTARLPFPKDSPAERRNQLLDTLVERLRPVPGITHVAYGTALPFVSFGGFTVFTMRSPRNPDVEMNVQAAQRIVTPEYFAAMRLRLVSGRQLSDEDTPSTQPVVVVNQTFARQFLGDRSIGFHIPQAGPRAGGIRFRDPHADWEVVGVVDDMRQDSVDGPPQPEVFASIKQISSATTNTSFDPIIVIRTAADPTRYVATLRGLVRELAPAQALDSVMTMEDRVMTSLAKPRLYAAVLAWFGVFALLVAGVGLFGVLSFTVAQRTREIGVRSALGARAFDIVMLVSRQVLWIVVAGVATGLLGALAGARLLAAFLYGVGPRDVLTFVAVPVVIVMVATVACLVPARRAAKVDPLVALRAG
jgi:hypothetical protein